MNIVIEYLMFNVWNSHADRGHRGYSICENFGGSVFWCMFRLNNTSYSNSVRRTRNTAVTPTLNLSTTVYSKCSTFGLSVLQLYRTSVFFQPFQQSGTLCSNFDCSRNPCLFGGILEALRAEIWGTRPRAGRGSWEGAVSPLPTS